MRCDKRLPCQQCIRQGSEEQCAIETVELSTKRTKSRQEIAFLKQVQLSLESSAATARQDALSLINRRLSLLETGQEPASLGKPQSDRNGFSDVLNDQNDDAFDTAMALMRLGRGYPAPVGSSHQELAPQPALPLWPSHLPDEEYARCLVSYYLEHLNWHHCVIHSTDFSRQCEQFWTTGEIVASQWMGMYFSVLAVSDTLEDELPRRYQTYRHSGGGVEYTEGAQPDCVR